MRRVIVASTNPVKLAATEAALRQAFPGENFGLRGVAAMPGVPEQPRSDKETLTGALNRVVSARALAPDADFYIGMEGGIEDRDGVLFSFSWIIAESASGKRGQGRSASYAVPDGIRHLIDENGLEYGHATDAFFGSTDSKRKGGTIEVLSGGAIDRIEMYRHAAIFALLPFIREDLY